MDNLEIVRRYLAAMAAGDPHGVSALFTENGVIDDLLGGRHVGRAGIRAFVESGKATRSAGEVRFSDPVRLIDEGTRTVAYGYVELPGMSKPYNVRWVFHFDGDLISHLGNSTVESFPKG